MLFYGPSLVTPCGGVLQGDKWKDIRQLPWSLGYSLLGGSSYNLANFSTGTGWLLTHIEQFTSDREALGHWDRVLMWEHWLAV